MVRRQRWRRPGRMTPSCRGSRIPASPNPRNSCLERTTRPNPRVHKMTMPRSAQALTLATVGVLGAVLSPAGVASQSIVRVPWRPANTESFQAGTLEEHRAPRDAARLRRRRHRGYPAAGDRLPDPPRADLPGIEPLTRAPPHGQARSLARDVERGRAPPLRPSRMGLDSTSRVDTIAAGGSTWTCTRGSECARSSTLGA
jgi:hypothetical protein